MMIQDVINDSSLADTADLDVPESSSENITREDSKTLLGIDDTILVDFQEKSNPSIKDKKNI